MVASAKIIVCEKDIRAGVRYLRRACPALRAAHDLAGDPPLRRYAADFAALARIVAGQQLSIASAGAIWRRFEALGPVTAESVVRRKPATLAKAGLSGAKIKTLKAIAKEAQCGTLDFAALSAMSDDDVRQRLVQIHGVGPWTADIFLMFSLGRADAWAPGDLALQVACGRVLGLAEKPSASALTEISERWRPWRGVAARLLWAYYAVEQNARGQTKTPV